MKNRRDGADQGIPRFHESRKQAELDGYRRLLVMDRLQEHVDLQERKNPEQESP